MNRGGAVAGAVRWLRSGDDPGRLVDALRAGAVAAIPTESSYGLAVDPLDAAAVERVFRIKGRSRAKALPVVVSDPGQLARLGIDPGAPEIVWASSIWPAPLSVLARLREPIPASAGLETLAVRVPAQDRLRAILDAAGGSLTATSANPSGSSPYLEAELVAQWLASLGIDAIVVDGGTLPGGPPSTLVDWQDGKARVLRAGRLTIV